MKNPLNLLDAWRERQRWLPAWLDDKDWKTWCWHSVFTLLGGALIGLLPWKFDAHLGFHLIVLFYLWREVDGALEAIREEKPVRWVDRTMDVISPLVVSELFARLFL